MESKLLKIYFTIYGLKINYKIKKMLLHFWLHLQFMFFKKRWKKIEINN